MDSEPSVTLLTMEVHFTPEQEARLTQAAANSGTDAEQIVKDAAIRFLDEDERYRSVVLEGIAAADRGEFVDDDEVRLWLEDLERSAG